MIECYCDNCGKKIEPSTRSVIRTSEVEINTDLGSWVFHLCDDCLARLSYFLDGLRENKILPNNLLKKLKG